MAEQRAMAEAQQRAMIMNTMMQCTPCLDVGPVAAANQAAFARALAAAQGVIQGGGGGSRQQQQGVIPFAAARPWGFGS